MISEESYKYRIWRGGLETGLHLIGTTTALIAAAAIGAGGSIGGAAIKARAAGKASKQLGESAFGAAHLAQSAAQTEHDDLLAAATAARGEVADATAASVWGVEEATGKSQDILGEVRGTGKEAIGEAYGTGAEALGGVYEAGKAELDPYLTMGRGSATQLTDLLAPGGEFNRRFGMEDYQEDPGYAFRLAEGQKALERSASARGRVLGGGTLKELSRYSQGVASQEYQSAFQRFQDENAARYGRLSGTAGMGLTAAGQAGQMGQWYGTNLSDLARWKGGSTVDLDKWYGGSSIGNLMTGAELTGGYRMRGAETGANLGMRGQESASDVRFRGALAAGGYLTDAGSAAAAGTIGAGNAWGGAVSGGAQSVMDSILLGQLLEPKVTKRPEIISRKESQ